MHIFFWVVSTATNMSHAGGHYRIGTLNESIHYRNNEDFNSSHDGIYIAHKNYVFGTYNNSKSEQSFFFARNKQINRTFSYSYGLVTGYSFGTLPLLGFSAQFNILKLTFTPEAAIIGLEFSL